MLPNELYSAPYHGSLSGVVMRHSVSITFRTSCVEEHSSVARGQGWGEGVTYVLCWRARAERAVHTQQRHENHACPYATPCAGSRLPHRPHGLTEREKRRGDTPSQAPSHCKQRAVCTLSACRTLVQVGFTSSQPPPVPRVRRALHTTVLVQQ
jgi:hypothetical protein